MTDNAYPDALPLHYRLHWYVLEGVLGQGGFGITYLARDSNLNTQVAIKEYLPVEVAQRRADATVRPRTDALHERYQRGLERFIAEARTLARFDHPNIVRVHSVFGFNDTAYMVMRFEEGENLAAVLERRRTLPEDELLRILVPILDGLALVHDAGFLHRDIKPDNIHLRRDGAPVLLDFGSARQTLGQSRTLTILVAPGYAPFEQYYGNPENQGPWTDIYGLAATCYRAIAGAPPLDAIARTKGILGSSRELMQSARSVGHGRYSEGLLAAIDHALEFAEKDRPQSIAEWRQELPEPRPAAAAPGAGQPVPGGNGAGVAVGVAAIPAFPVPPTATVVAPGTNPPPLTKREDGRSLGARTKIAWAIGGALGTVVALGVAWQFRSHEKDIKRQQQAVEAEQRRVEQERQKLEVAGRQVAEQRQHLETQQRAVEEQQRREALQQTEEKRQVEQRRQVDEKLPRDDRRRRDEAAQLAKAATVRPARPDTGNPSAAPDSALPMRPAEPPPVVSRPPAAGASTPGSPLLIEAAAKAATPPAVPTQPPVPAPPTVDEQLAAAARAVARGDGATAVRTLQPLAEAGHSRAQLRLGDLFEAGRGGIPRDDAQAYVWYRKAAEQADSEARLKLGHLYAKGRGVPVNHIQAYIWYSLAARGGSAGAEEPRQKMAAILQPAEIRQADKLVDSMLPRAR